MEQTDKKIEQKHIQQEVVITDIKMSFGSMVEFMVKWAIASIPAFIILVFIAGVLAGLLGGLGITISKLF